MATEISGHTHLKSSKIPGFRRLKNALRRDHHVKSPEPSSLDAPVPRDDEHSPSEGRDTFTQDGTTYAEDQLLYLVNEVKDYQLAHGSLLKPVRHHDENFALGRGIGVSILPTSFPQRSFEEALALQHAFNALYVNVASDPEWLYSVFEPLLKDDDFLAKLWDIYHRVRDAGTVQDLTCGIFRSDYMLHQPGDNGPVELKQVEMNTVSCAGACHAERIANMHRQLTRVREASREQGLSNLPANNNTQSIVHALKAAHEAYTPTGAQNACVLMTVQPYNFNTTDERPIEYGLWDASVPCYRCEWQTILERTTLTQDRTLFFRPPFGANAIEVSVIYYRGGYAAAEYREQSWNTRLRLEMSRAIKCPDILTHLTTFKVVQAALTRPGVLEKFLSSDDNGPETASTIATIRQTFMPMQILDTSPEGMQARGLLTDPRSAAAQVLKPNLEGGGNNIYGEEIPATLADIPPERWHMYTLMQMIEPPTTITGTLMPPSELHHGEVISELGVLGTCLWRRGGGRRESGRYAVEILSNECAGWTFKTKPADVEEMSVVKGYGCFDCPRLVE